MLRVPPSGMTIGSNEQMNLLAARKNRGSASIRLSLKALYRFGWLLRFGILVSFPGCWRWRTRMIGMRSLSHLDFYPTRLSVGFGAWSTCEIPALIIPDSGINRWSINPRRPSRTGRQGMSNTFQQMCRAGAGFMRRPPFRGICFCKLTPIRAGACE